MLNFDDYVKNCIDILLEKIENNFFITNKNPLKNNIINLNLNFLKEQYLIYNKNINDKNELNLTWNDFDFEILFTKIIENNKIQYEEIDLSYLNLNDYTLFLISQMIRNQIKIKKLNLNHNNFKEDGLISFFDNLKFNSYINNISFKGIILNEKIIIRLFENFVLDDNLETVDCGIVGNLFLEKLNENLNKIKCKHLLIEEDLNMKWNEITKNEFIKNFEIFNKNLLSLNIDSKEIYRHFNFIGNIGLILERVRDEKEIEIYKKFQKKNTLKETQELEILNIEKIKENFSNRKYIDNIFESIIEESLFLIEKEQKNKLRSKKKLEKTGIEDNKEIEKYDIFSVEGCCYKLAVYLMNYVKNI